MPEKPSQPLKVHTQQKNQQVLSHHYPNPMSDYYTHQQMENLQKEKEQYEQKIHHNMRSRNNSNSPDAGNRSNSNSMDLSQTGNTYLKQQMGQHYKAIGNDKNQSSLDYFVRFSEKNKD